MPYTPENLRALAWVRNGSKPSAPVDVLAVMDRAAGLLIGCPDDDVAEDCSADVAKARAAIAELISVSKDSRDSLSAANMVYQDGAIGLLIERLTAALARVGGGL